MLGNAVVTHALLNRSLLLVLLAVDWAADPCQGTSPLSSTLHSTIVFCHSLVYRGEISRRCGPEVRPEPRRQEHGKVVGCLEEPEQPPTTTPATNFPAGTLVYLFMSLRR
jgi:hypothetical protein